MSFNHFGERGRYDLIAYHPATGIVLVVEIKTGIGDVQATLGTLDMKVRLALEVAREQGWGRPLVAVPALVIADERQQHRIVQQHAELFSRYGVTGRTARAWLRAPSTGATGILFYLPLTNARTVSVRAAARGQRVRNAAGGTTKGGSDGHTSSLGSDSSR